MILLRLLLLPFTLLYGIAIGFRQFLYHTGVLSRTTFDIPVICIGNLSAGGTGKTPHVAWLIAALQHRYPLALLSRGYKRKTTGYVFASGDQVNPDSIGDEPYLLKSAFPSLPVAVCESRVLGIPSLLSDAPDTHAVVMDDGYQHLALHASLYILLTDYNHLFTTDWLIPSGLLREFRSGYKRAHFIVVTKCPADLPLQEKEKIRKAIRPLPHQKLLFSSFVYDRLKPLFPEMQTSAHSATEVLSFCGIARPESFETHLKQTFQAVSTIQFRDHHLYTENDLTRICTAFHHLQGPDKIIVCTEKDAVKLRELKSDHEFFTLPVFYQPIRVHIQDEQEHTIPDAVASQIEDSLRMTEDEDTTHSV